MDYHHMSEESSSSSATLGDLANSSDSPTKYQATGSSLPLSSPPTPPQEPPVRLHTEVNIDTETPSRPVVLTIHTSAQLKPQGNGAPLVAGVMTSQQAVKRRSTPHEEHKDDSGATEQLSPISPTDIKKFKDPAGDRYVKHESMLERTRSLAKRLITHLAFRVITILLILVDLSIVIVSVVKATTAENPSDPQLKRELYQLDAVALAFSCYFILEIGLRIFAETPRVFFRQALEIVDCLVVLISFIVVVADLAIDENSLEYIKIITGLRLLRLIRFGMLLRVAITQRAHLLKASRLLVSENKRRYQKEGFDLDLCYVTDRMIAMSYPSQGFMSVYRNPIEEVSRFFNTKYPNSYRIYNCCSERHYDAEKYFNDAVVRVMIDDHNVPSLQQMIDFVNDVQQWMKMDRSNVIAIHCKGGKGRTGTMACIWLIHTRTFPNANDALDYFGSRRTDLSVGSKFQGVETPSQSRYVNYYEKMLNEHDGKIPEERMVKPTKVSVSGLKGIGTEDGRDLIVKFIISGDVIYEAKFGTDTNCTTIFERESSTITASLINAPNLTGDIKVRFEATSNIPCDYDDCPWFFWFNTSFIENNELTLGREDLDNPHQKRSWKLYKPDFGVVVQFEAVQ